ncbi:MAG TPA: glycosyltransferase [Cyclobacteriaceae bacterium]|jgi:GT2 family glycosyltransferase|nr:glycosyltransferase [Cyclobacteriaceae bacterium]
MMKVSLIISVYKNVDDLKVVLDGLKYQTYKSFEIVVSEDGEYEPMKTFLSTYQHPNSILHITQPDVGWRKNQALNNAIRKSSGDYLIFIDGDCVLHHKFIEHHVQYADKNHVVAGKRVKLGPTYSDLFRKQHENLLQLEKRVEKERSALKKDGVRFYEEAFYIDPKSLLGFIPRLRKMSQLKGCNMSFHREILEKINGFDEDYKLPAIGEDIDLTWRLEGLGFKLFSVRNLAVQYHLHHKENWTDQSVNENIMAEKVAMKKFICENGLVHKPNEFVRKPMKVLLVEYKFHQEIIPTQLKFLLDANIEVHLFLNQKLWDDDLLGAFQKAVMITLLKYPDKWYNKVGLFFVMRSYIKRFGITHIIFNTLDSNFNSLITRIIGGIHYVGIVHRVSKHIKNNEQRALIDRVDGVLTLSEQTLNNFKEVFPKKENISCFYPIFFQWDPRPYNNDSKEINVVIPGQFDAKKRDFQPLLKAAAVIKEKGLPIKFILLGDASNMDGKNVVLEIKQRQLESQFIYQERFIAYNDFFEWISKADYILPLFTRRIHNYESYLKSQISASFSWALAFQKTLILPEDFSKMQYVSENAIFYNENEIEDKLISLKKNNSYSSSANNELSFAIQRDKYLKVFKMD